MAPIFNRGGRLKKTLVTFAESIIANELLLEFNF